MHPRSDTELLRDLLRLYPTSQEDRAAAVGRTQSTVQRWEAEFEKGGTVSFTAGAREGVLRAIERAEAGPAREREEMIIAARWMQKLAARLLEEAATPPVPREQAEGEGALRTTEELRHSEKAPARPRRASSGRGGRRP